MNAQSARSMCNVKAITLTGQKRSRTLGSYSKEISRWRGCAFSIWVSAVARTIHCTFEQSSCWDSAYTASLDITTSFKHNGKVQFCLAIANWDLPILNSSRLWFHSSLSANRHFCQQWFENTERHWDRYCFLVAFSHPQSQSTIQRKLLF